MECLPSRVVVYLLENFWRKLAKIRDLYLVSRPAYTITLEGKQSITVS